MSRLLPANQTSGQVILSEAIALTIRCVNEEQINTLQQIQISTQTLCVQYKNYRISEHGPAGKLS